MQTKENKIYIAFPGMGKTTYAKKVANFLDLDFGTFREALHVKKEDETSLLVPFSRMMKYYYKDGYNILTNEYKLIPYIKQFAEGNIVMILPKDQSDLVERVFLREQNRHVNATFPTLLRDNIKVWVNDWSKFARKYGIPVHYYKYFKEV